MASVTALHRTETIVKHTLLQSWPAILILIALGLVGFFWKQSKSLEQTYVERTQLELRSRRVCSRGNARS